MNSARDHRETVVVGRCSENSPIVAGGLTNAGLSTRLDIGGEADTTLRIGLASGGCGVNEARLRNGDNRNMDVRVSMGESKEGLIAWSRSYNAN